MPWYLALQGSASVGHQSPTYELQDSVDVDKLAEELVSSATLDRVVAVPAVLPQNTSRQQKVTLYVRPAAWGMWTFYELTDEDKRQLLAQNPVLSALARGAAAKGQTPPAGPGNPLINQPFPK